MPTSHQREEPSEAERAEALRRRLMLLINERSQSEIARRTGASISAVNRYVHGARVPAEFCGALISGLGVNPAWLMAGEGSPYLADLPADTAKLGANLLELVESMSAVTRMKLGSLAGKPDLKVLRGLNDALLAHQQLRGKLNDQSRPWFAKLLADFKAALGARDLPAANELRKAVDQLARLCDDETLEIEHMRLRAAHEFQLRNTSRYLAYQRKVFARSLSEAALLDEVAFDESRRLAVALGSLGRFREALRVCRAIKVLAGPAGRRWKSYWAVQSVHGVTYYDLGDIRRGLPLVQEALPNLEGVQHEVTEDALTRMLLWSGAVSLPDACGMGKRTALKASNFLEYAAWMEQPAAIERAAKYFDARKFQGSSPKLLISAYAAFLHKVLKGTVGPDEVEDLRISSEQEFGNQGATMGMRLAAYAAHLFWTAGDKARAQSETLKADEHLGRLSQGVGGEYPVLATHYRNALRAAPDSPQMRPIKKRALKFFRQGAQRGQATFQTLLAQFSR